MKWFLYLTNLKGKRFVASYYGYTSKNRALEDLKHAQKLVDKGQLLKAELSY